MSNVLFASSNENKYKEAKAILSKFDIKLGFFKCNLQEIQADTLEEIALHKVTQAFSQCSGPVIVEDDGLFIESLNGFPGPYSAFAFKTIGNKGILNLLKAKRNNYKKYAYAKWKWYGVLSEVDLMKQNGQSKCLPLK